MAEKSWGPSRTGCIHVINGWARTYFALGPCIALNTRKFHRSPLLGRGSVLAVVPDQVAPWYMPASLPQPWSWGEVLPWMGMSYAPPAVSQAECQGHSSHSKTRSFILLQDSCFYPIWENKSWRKGRFIYLFILFALRGPCRNLWPPSPPHFDMYPMLTQQPEYPFSGLGRPEVANYSSCKL